MNNFRVTVKKDFGRNRIWEIGRVYCDKDFANKLVLDLIKADSPNSPIIKIEEISKGVSKGV